jgi:hypothetical protein
MQKGKIKLTQKDAENTPAGGVVVGKREGQTMIYSDASLGGYFVGRLHRDGGIKMINKSTGQPLEVQGSEVIITAPAVNDPKLREFEGKMMTNREILSKINSDGGGVSFEQGGDIPSEMSYRGSSYNFGGKTMTDYEIMQEISKCGCSHDDFEDGKSRGKSLSDIAKMHNVSLAHINEQVEMGLKVESEHTSNYLEQMQIVKDHLVENPDYYTILNKVGLENGGETKKQDLVKDAKDGNTPARDLNNYNDVLDLGADGVVGGDSGLAFEDGGSVENLKVGEVFVINNEGKYKGLLLYDIADDATNFFPNGTKLTLSKLDSNGDEDYKIFNLKNQEEKAIVSISKTTLKQLIEKKDLVLVSSKKDFGESSIDDLLGEAEKAFDDGGSVGLTKVAYVKVFETGASLAGIKGNLYTSYIEFAESIKYAYENIGKKVRSWIYLDAYDGNDTFLVRVFTNISDQKNTVKNYNPFTGTYLNLEKSLLNSSPFLFKKYDWNDWLNSRTISTQHKSVMVDVVRLEFNFNNSFQKRFSRNGERLLEHLKDIDSFERMQPKSGVIDVKIIAEVTDDTGRIYSKERTVSIGREGFVPSNYSIDNLKEVCQIWFDKLDFTNFFEKNNSVAAQPSSNKKTLTPEEIKNSKIWIGDDPDLSLAVRTTLTSLGFPLDSSASSSSFINGEIIKVYTRDFTRLDGDKLAFYQLSGTEIFPSDLGIDVISNSGASASSTGSSTNTTPTNVPIRTLTREEIKNSKIFMGSNPKLKAAVQRNLFDKGFYWASGDKEPKYLNDDDVQALKILNNSILVLQISEFNNDLNKEIKPIDLGIDVDSILGIGSNQSKNVGASQARGLITDLTDTKIWIGDNPELSKAVQEKAFELGWAWALGGKTISHVERQILVFTKNEIFFNPSTSKSGFDIISGKEIFPKQLGIDVNNLGGSAQTQAQAQPQLTAPTKILTKEDLVGTKIWIGFNPELSKSVQEKLNALGLYIDPRYSKESFTNGEIIGIYSKDFAQFDNTLSGFYGLSEKQILPSELGINVDQFGVVSTSSKNDDLTESRLKMLMQIKDFVDSKSLTVYPANIESDATVFVHFIDEQTNKMFQFSERDGGLYPKDEASSKLLFDFLAFQKEFTSFMKKKLNESLNKYLADERKLYTRDFEKLEADLTKDKIDLEDLKRLLPSFQEARFAKEKAMILKEMKRLHEKITNDGFIFTNQLMATSDSLFTPQGMLKYYFDQTTQNPTAKLEDACKLPTPNGKESKLPLSAYFNIRTKQFKNWFGDWEMAYETGNYFNCSKMIDEETKEPKIFFHGVRKYVPNFGNFSNMGQGVVRPYGSFEPPTAFPASYFSDNEDYAKFYGGIAPNMPKPSDDYEPFIYKVFLSAKNPLSLIPLGFEASYQDLLDYLLVVYGIKKLPSANVLNRINNNMTGQHPVWVYVRNDISLLETIKEYGYDALIQIGDIPTFDSDGNVVSDRSKFIQEEEYLTFFPSQVKSATVLKSFYFDFFKDIRFNKGGYVRL